jgi:CHAT domain-containing protein
VAPYARLIICPDQLLGLIPFASLYHAQSGRYLVEDHDVVIAPSATTWAHISPSHHATPKQCLVAGWSSGGRLPQAVSEAQAVATDLAQAGCAVQTLLEGAATLDAFVQNISQQDLIYVASHGLYRPDAPARSYIELADGLLTTDHIAGLKLQAACVILSACETGVGHLSGNELMGFVRAFLHAGARSVIATHWPVDDAAMKALMARFTTCLGPNFDVTSAFCEAQRAMMRKAKDDQNAHRLAHPYYWGALSVIGRS